MNKIITAAITFFLLLNFHDSLSQDRIKLLEQRLFDLSQNVSGLNQRVETSVSNGSLKDFLSGIASTHNLNFQVDPSINQRITVYFSDEKVLTVLVYLARQYELDYTFTGSIISISPYRNPLSNLPPPPKELRITYNPSILALTMDLQDDSLLNVAKRITQISGKNIVVLPELYSRKITAYIQNMPVENALEKLAILNSFKLNKTNDDSYVLEALKPGEELVTHQNTPANSNFSVRRTSPSGGGVGGPSSASINIGQDATGKKTITLNVVNSPIKEIIKNIAEQAGISYFVYSEING
ncbi:MAG: hypothetical protein J7497_08705, partial [Chitinophagaceae bacterium]|nr:hypothetical protein [Chitinophagaceae bacterium]